MLAALKWGAIVGVAAYAVGIALGFISLSLTSNGSTVVTDRPILLVPICLTIFLLLFAASAAGFYTGRETGIAGFGAIAGIAMYIVTYVLGLLYSPAHQTTVSSSPLWTQALSIALDLGIAACMGWLGGRPGAQRSPLRIAPPAQVAPFDLRHEQPPAES